MATQNGYCTDPQVRFCLNKNEISTLLKSSPAGNEESGLMEFMILMASHIFHSIICTRPDCAADADLNPIGYTSGKAPVVDAWVAQLTADLLRRRFRRDGELVPMDHPTLAFGRMIAANKANIIKAA